MTSKRVFVAIGLGVLIGAGATVAAEQPSGSPNLQFELAGLSMPSDVAIDEAGTVYVVDSGNDQVTVFSPSGARVLTLGSRGKQKGEFISPLGIGVGPAGNIWVADKGNGRIAMFDSKARVGVVFTPELDGVEVVPVDVAVGPAGRELFVTTSTTHQVAVFSVNGEFLRAWGGEGEENGQFRYPAAIDIDAAGNVYVVDVLNARVQKFAPDGTHLLTIGKRGGRLGTFFRPKGVALNDAGQLFVSDSFLGVVQVFDADGTPAYVLGDAGVATVFDTPVGMAVRGNRLYVAQMLPGKVAVLEPQAPPPVAKEAAE